MPPTPPVSLAAQALQRLRERAKKSGVYPTPRPGPAAQPDELQRLVQDLQVYQSELETQLEELLAAQAATETARTVAEAAQAQYAELYDFAPAALFALDADGAIARLNDRACHLLGAAADRLLDRRFLRFVAPESRDAFLTLLAAVQGSTQRHTAELRLQTEAGTGLLALVEGRASTTTPGAPGAQLAVMDVTLLRQKAAPQPRGEERLHRALEAAGTGVWEWTLATNVLHWDARAQACFGTPSAATPASLAALRAALHPADEAGVALALQATVRQGLPLDLTCRVQWPDGSVHHLAVGGRLERDARNQPESLIGLVREVTGRRGAEQELGYRTRQLLHLRDHMPVLLGRLSPTGEYLELMGAGLRRMGIADNALVGSSVFDAFPDLAEPLRRLLAGEQVNFVSVADGLSQRLHFQYYGFFDEQRQQAVLFAIDVTESERTKSRLREEQEFSKNLLNHSVDGVAAFDGAGRLTAWNRVMEALTGRAEAEALGQEAWACLPFERASAPGRSIDDLLHGTHRPRFHQAFAWPGSTRDFELTAIPLPGPAGPAGAGGLLLLHDVTERNRLQASAVHVKAQQQRETFRVVLMAQEVERKRIAEALHNGVGQLLYATKLHLEDCSGDPAALALLEEAIKATRSVSFELMPRVLEDFGLAVALQKLQESIPPQKLRLRLYLTGLDRPLPPVLTLAVYRMVQELLNNVVKHARAEEATLHVAYEGDSVHVSMEDDGGGFDPAAAAANGPGIGLPALHNRAALLGGQFELVSRPGRGTIATLTLPVVEGEA